MTSPNVQHRGSFTTKQRIPNGLLLHLKEISARTPGKPAPIISRRCFDIRRFPQHKQLNSMISKQQLVTDKSGYVLPSAVGMDGNVSIQKQLL